MGRLDMEPELLKKGNTIGVIAFSGTCDDEETLEEMNVAKKYFEEQGFKIKFGNHIEKERIYGNAHPKNRVKDLEEMLKDSKIKAIFALKGGNDSISMFEYLDFDLIKKYPKIYMGYSDTTSILNVINEKTGLITYHGSTFKSILRDFEDYSKKAILDRLVKNNKKLAYESDFDEIKIIRSGNANGKLIGGNISLITDLISGKYKVNFKDKILFLEELAYESDPVKIAHDLYKIKHEGIFDEIKGIWIGNYENEIQIEDILLEVIDDIEFEKPIIKSNNFGHCNKRILIPIGMEAIIDTTKEKPYIFLK